MTSPRIRLIGFSTFILSILLCSHILAAAPDLWQDFRDSQQNGKEPILPDFSWAGYHYSEKSIPAAKGRIFNIADFGGEPDDNKYDDEALQNAINAAQSQGGGIVFFAAGRYMFCPKIDFKKGVDVSASNIVLRGSGSGDGGTELFIDKMNTKNGSCYFTIAPQEPEKKVLASIVEAAQRETHEVKVDNAAGLQSGQTVVIRYGGSDFIKVYFSPLLASKNWKRIFEKGFPIHELHTIESVNGDRVRFREPLHLTIRPQDDEPFQIWSFPMIEEVGIEDIRFTGNWSDDNPDTWLKGKPRKFVHHRKGDPMDDYGWEALRMRGVRNGWVRNCEFRNLNTGIYLDSCAAVTAESLVFTGKKGHTSVHTRRGYGVLVQNCIDRAGYWHGPGMGYSGVGTVYLRHQMAPGQSIDSHSGSPYATLLDSIQGGQLAGNGGPYENYPHHGKHLVVWNFEQRGGTTRYDFWPGDRRNSHTFCLPIFAGHHGIKVQMKNELYNISPGKQVEPASLFDAQLKLRLSRKQSEL